MTAQNFKSALAILSACVITGITACSSTSGYNSATTTDKNLQARVFTAKKIITMQASRPSAKAVAVSGDRIVAVGSLNSIKKSLPDHQLSIDDRFADKVIMPGLIENHLHPALAGMLLPSTFITPWDWDLPGRNIKGVQGRDDYLKRLRQVEASLTDPAEMLITWGYHQYFHSRITRADLDEVSGTRPIIVWHRSFHEIVANTAALKLLEVAEQDYTEHPAINFEDGHFWELGLFAIFPKLAPVIFAPQRFTSGVLDGFVHAQMNGITTLADQGVPLMNLEMELGFLDQVLTEHALPLRMLLVANGKTLAPNGFEEGLAATEQLVGQRLNSPAPFLPGQIKLLADGAFYSQLMQMEDGYLDGHHGEWIMPPAELEEAARIYWKAGYQLHIHVNGDKGLNVVLGVIERLQAEAPRDDHQTVLHHYGYSGAEHAQRLADLGISVSANPYYLWALADKYAEVGLGKERADYITRLGDLERHGVEVSLHSDLPMAPADPLRLAGIAASRITANGNIVAAEEKMSVTAALRGITIDAARAIQQQENIGTIEVGKLADFAVLEQDPYSVAPENFKDIPIWGTVLGGEIYPRPQH